jgi:hypothetical protein
MLIVPGPKSFKAALKDTDSEQWLQVIQLELEAMKEHHVFEFIPDDSIDPHQIIPSKWVLGLKLNADGTTNKWKARLIGRGDRQIGRRDFGDITSLVVDSTSIQLVLSIAARHDLDIMTLDFLMAFLGCPLEETIYMCLPEGLWGSHDPYKRERPIVHLHKTLYGVRQANLEFTENVFDFAVDPEGLGLKASIASPGLFYHDNKPVYILVYVDDLMLVSPMNNITPLRRKLEQRFKASGPPPSDAFQYLGMMIHRDRASHDVYLDQLGYIQKILDRFGMSGSSPVLTPIDPGFQASKISPDKAPANITTYQQMTGSLLYAAIRSRPDISYAVGVLGCFAFMPAKRSYLTTAKHLL